MDIILYLIIAEACLLLGWIDKRRTERKAQELGRCFVGAELSEEYCKIAVERLRQPSFFSIPDEPAAEPKQAAMWGE